MLIKCLTFSKAVHATFFSLTFYKKINADLITLFFSFNLFLFKGFNFSMPFSISLPILYSQATHLPPQPQTLLRIHSFYSFPHISWAMDIIFHVEQTSWSPATRADLIVSCLPQAATSLHASMCKFVCSPACTSAQSSSLPWHWCVQSSWHPFFTFFKAVRTDFLFFTHSISWTWWQ